MSGVSFQRNIMPTRVIEPPHTRRYNLPIDIGNIEGNKLYVQFGPEPTDQRPREIWGFKIAWTGETPFNDSHAIIFENIDASRIASDIATALNYIAEGRSPPYNPQPARGYPEIRVEKLVSRDVRIANGETEILIPWACVLRLGEVLENRVSPPSNR